MAAALGAVRVYTCIAWDLEMSQENWHTRHVGAKVRLARTLWVHPSSKRGGRLRLAESQKTLDRRSGYFGTLGLSVHVAVV